MLVGQFVALFSDAIQERRVFENITTYESTWTLGNIVCPDLTKLAKLLSGISKRDEFSLHVKLEFSEGVTLYKAADAETFCQQLSKTISNQEEDEKITLVLTITKKCQNNVFSIYSFESFIAFLTERSFVELIDAFKIVIENECNCFEVLEDDFTPFKTETLSFRKEGTTSRKTDIDRAKKIDKIKSVTHYGSINQFQLLPEDFKIENRVSEYSSFNIVLDRLCLLFCIISIYDITTNEANGISYKLKGYKSISGQLDFVTLNTNSLNEYYDIYTWIYVGGNVTDKIGLARNIISIHLDVNHAEVLVGSPYYSIESGYDIYLKDNIKQYIEVRNKISDQLLDFNKRATTIVDTFASGFQKACLTLITFYSSMLAIKFLSSSSINVMFNENVTLLSVIFIAIAIAYLIVSRLDVKSQRLRFAHSYDNLKARYTDLLTENDIKKILKDDIDFKADLTFINDKVRWYTVLWVFVIVLISIAVAYFYYSGWKFIGINLLFQRLVNSLQ